MKFIQDQTETQIYNALMSRETTFTVKGIELKENVIVGTQKERERKCRAKAKELAQIVNSI